MKFNDVYKVCARELKYQAMGAVRKNNVGPLHVPLVRGGVGTGKTSLAKMLAEELALPLITINSGESSDGTDVTGVPFPQNVSEEWVTRWAPNAQIYRATQEPVLLHFDDVDKALPPAQNALIGIIGERCFRDTKLHPGSLLLLTGNRTEDDMYANELSESIKTRATDITLEPDAVTWAAWGQETGLIHPLLSSYVLFKPEHIHVISDEDNRHTTPRGYREASDQMRYEPETEWDTILKLKLGTSVGVDIWAYYNVYSKIDIPYILKEGKVSGDNLSDENQRMVTYASIFALTQALNTNKYPISKTKSPGLPIFIESMSPEARIGLLVQLDKKVRTKLVNTWSDLGEIMLNVLVN